jgi:hypothetical protein
MLDGDGRNLSEHDCNDSFAEYAKPETFATKEEWEEFDGNNPHHGVEEERVAEGVDEDECNCGTGTRWVFGSRGKFG